MAFKDRLREARTTAGLTQREIGEPLGVTPQAVSGWERGEGMPESDKLAVIAQQVERSVDWLLGHDDADMDLDAPTNASRRVLEVVGYAGAGGKAHFYPTGDLDEIPATDRDPSKAVAVEIRGKSLGPLFDRWYAIYDDVRRPITDDLINELCVVGLDDGQVFVKQIRRRGKHLDLKSNSEDEPIIKNVKIEWAAKVTDIRARRR